ncbi:MAG: YihY/virulence factor BrkB family protein [Desulfobacterota bacterium]|nr:YihY/virulence factor BrkB family protein [Thermodesulfobacteriota bacterium]
MKRKTPQKSAGFIHKLDQDDIFFLASGLAFNLLICFIPLILVVLSILGFFLHSQQQVLETIQAYLGRLLPQASPRMTAIIVNLVKDRQIVGLVGFAGLIWTAMRLFGSIRTVLNKTLEIVSHHSYLREKLHDLIYVLISGILFFLSFILSAIFDLLKTIPGKLGLPPLLDVRWWGWSAGLLVAYFFSVLMFFVLFRVLPSRKPPSRAAFFSALLIGGLWELAKYLFRLYIDYINYFTAVYGSFGLLVAFILWVYYSCSLFVLGGELMWLMMRTRK